MKKYVCANKKNTLQDNNCKLDKVDLKSNNALAEAKEFSFKKNEK